MFRAIYVSAYPKTKSKHDVLEFIRKYNNNKK